MGLKEAIQSAVGGGFNAFGNVRLSGVYHVTSTSYNATTGETTDTITDHNIQVIREEFSTSDLGVADKSEASTPKAGDFKLLLPNHGLKFGPSTKDTITISGLKHNIVGKKIDPADAVWILHVRARG